MTITTSKVHMQQPQSTPSLLDKSPFRLSKTQLIPTLGLLAALAFSTNPTAVFAKTAGGDQTSTMNTSAHPSKKKGPKKVTYQRSSSEESTAEHDRRMARECKGLHNAGACRGYTR